MSLGKQLQGLKQNGFLSAIIPEYVSLLSKLTGYLNSGFSFLTNYVAGLFSFFSNFAVILITFPILLFYMLKEGEKFGQKIVSIVPKRFREDAAGITM